MTQSELLNYILEKEKLKKEDLAKLFGIRKKNLERTLNGELLLTKRQIKNISQFTKIPEELIKSDEVTLPDLQNTGVVFINEELVKIQNTIKIQDFIRNRFKLQFIGLFLLKLFVYFILIFLSIFVGCAFYSAFIENIDRSTTFSAFFTLVPYLLGFASIVPIFKVIKKVNFNEVKRVKLYYYFIIVANLISLMSIIVLNANHWGFFISGLIGTFIPLVFLILENNKKFNQKQIKILSTVLIFAACFVIGVIPGYPETNREMYFGIIPAVLNLVLVATHICYWAIKDLSEFSNKFQMLNDKKCLKKKKVLRSLFSVLLVTIIVAGGVHIAKLIIIKASMDYALADMGSNFEFEKHSEYNKSNIEFTEEDETITVEMDEFTYKIPAELIDKTNKEIQSESNEILTYKNEAETIMVISTYQPIDEPYPSIFEYDESFFASSETDEDSTFDESIAIGVSKYGEMVKNVLVEKYGFYPKNDYESRKLSGMIDLDDINYWDKQEVNSFVCLAIFYAVATPIYDESYFYETEEIEGYVDILINTNEETDEISYSYIFSFNKCDSDWLDCRLMVRLPEEVASTDLAYKIINSVEMK